MWVEGGVRGGGARRGRTGGQRNAEVVVLGFGIRNFSHGLEKLPIAGVKRILRPPDRGEAVAGTEGHIDFSAVICQEVNIQVFHLRISAIHLKPHAFFFLSQPVSSLFSSPLASIHYHNLT